RALLPAGHYRHVHQRNGYRRQRRENGRPLRAAGLDRQCLRCRGIEKTLPAGLPQGAAGGRSECHARHHRGQGQEAQGAGSVMAIEVKQAALTLPRIKVARLERGWTVRQLAAAAGVSLATVSRVEAGREPSLQVALRLARALDFPIEELWTIA